MSPQHFKAFVRSVNETLTAYESVFGALQVPEGDIAPMHTAEQLQKRMLENRDRVKAQIEAAAKSSSAPSSTEKKPPSKRSRGVARE
jgi:hypothetical protein